MEILKYKSLIIVALNQPCLYLAWSVPHVLRAEMGLVNQSSR